MRLATTIKVITLLVVLTAAIFGFGFYTKHFIDLSAKRLEDMISSLEASTASQNWEEAQKELVIIQDDWEKTKKTWAMLLDHTEIDNIDEALSKLKMYIETRESSLALAEASTLKLFIIHIPEREALNLENVF
jgi:hypothetical protein